MPKRKSKSTADNPSSELEKPEAKSNGSAPGSVPTKTPANGVTKKGSLKKKKPKTTKSAVTEAKTVAVVPETPAAVETKEDKGIGAVVDLTDVRRQEDLITQSKENFNLIGNLIQIVVEKQGATESVPLVVGVSQSLRRVFNRLAASGDLVCLKSSAEADATKAELRERFREYQSGLLGLLMSGDVRLQASALHALFDAVKVEWLEESRAGSAHELRLCQLIMLAMCAAPILPEAVLTDLKEKFLLPHSDLRSVSLKALKVLAGSPWGELEKQIQASVPETWKLPGLSREVFVGNLVEVLLRMPQEPPSSDQLWGGTKAEVAKSNVKEGKTKKPKDPHVASLKLLGDCWTTLLQAALPKQVYRIVLVQLRKHILPVLSNPLILADMLTDAFDMGGVVSLLALDGLFVLMTKHNLEYPKFYSKLYSLCKPHLLQAKHRGKFFTLLSLSLTSSHLPASLVAAFAKRLSRLALTANPPALIFLCTAVFNLLRRHPACRYLVHKPPATAAPATSGLLVAPVVEEVKPLTKDPFVAEEDDPALSQATLTSLWEMQTLTNHYCPQVVRAAKELFAENALKSKDLDVQATVEHTYQSLIETELEWRKNQPTPLTYENPGSLFTKTGLFSFA